MCFKKNFERDDAFYVYNPASNRYDIYNYQINSDKITVLINREDNDGTLITFNNINDFYLFKKRLLKTDFNLSKIIKNIFYISGTVFFVSVLSYFCINSDNIKNINFSNNSENSMLDISQINPVDNYIKSNIPDENVRKYIESLVQKDLEISQENIEENKSVVINTPSKEIVSFEPEVISKELERSNKASDLLEKIKKSKNETNISEEKNIIENTNRVNIERKDVISNVPTSESWLTKGASIDLPLPGGGKNIRSVEDLLNFGENN